MKSKVTKSEGNRQINVHKNREPGNITSAGLLRKLKTKLNYTSKIQKKAKGLMGVSKKIMNYSTNNQKISSLLVGMTFFT